jgi:tetratricopeptide (TPR) repeat protein
MLREADDTVLQTAAESAGALPDVSDCTDESMLARRATAPSEQTRATVRELGQRLAAVEILLAANRPADALAEVEAVLVAVEPLGPHALHARALAFAGEAHGALGDHPRHAALAQDAVVMALRVDDAETTFDGIVGLMGALHETGARERAAWWAVPAEAILNRLGEADDLRGAELLESQAMLSVDVHEIRALSERGLEIRQRRLGPDHPLVGLSLSNIGAALQRAGATDEAKHYHERGLAVRERALGPDHPHVANSLVNVAQPYILARDFAKARELTARALVIWENALGPNHRNCALALGNLAAIHMYMDDHAGAQPLLERALAVVERAHGPEHPFMVGHLVNLATIHQRRGDLDETGRLLSRAATIAEAWGGPNHSIVATPLLGLSEIDLLRGDTRAATPRLERALAILERTPQDRPNLAHARWALARAIWESRPQRARAVALARSAIAEYRDLDGDWSRDVDAIETWLAAHTQL